MTFMDRLRAFFGGSSKNDSSASVNKGKSKMAKYNLHPAVNSGVKAGKADFAGGTLQCHCSDNKVEVTLDANVAFNHACGCSKCWKPDDAIFSVIAVVSKDKLKVTANEDKLKIVDKKAVIQRHACSKCGVHMYGRIEDENHAFYGLDFVHTELSDQQGWSAPEFAAFVSSIIEQGFPIDNMGEVRSQFDGVGLPTYDVLAPALMDLIAANNYKLAQAKK